MPKISSQEKIIHDQFVQYGRSAKEWMRRCVLLLPGIVEKEIWKKKGFGSIHEYAGKLAGMSRYKVNESLRILSKVEDKPELMKVIEEKGVFAVNPVVTIATVETAKFWAEKSRLMTKNTLEVYVKEFRYQNGLFDEKNDDFGRPRTPNVSNNNSAYSSAEEGAPPLVPRKDAPEFIAEKKMVAMDLDPEIAHQLQKLKGQGSWNDLMKHLLQMRNEHLEEQKPEAVQTDSRHIPAKIVRYVLERTNGQCAYPCCAKPYNIFQHTQRWALENVHDPDRLYPLCTEHERLAHLGLIEHEDLAPQFWKIRNAPDYESPKFDVDRIVNKFRVPK